MNEVLPPFSKSIDLHTGVISKASLVVKRHLNDLKGLFADEAAEAAMQVANPLLYEVYDAVTEIPEEDGQLRYATTIMYPGKVGDEYFFTKGHSHKRANRTELYLGLAGKGYLLLQTPEGEISALPMESGTMAYIPPYWEHRTLNVGTDNFIFLATFSADAGCDYTNVAKRGFSHLMVEHNGMPILVPNQKWTE